MKLVIIRLVFTKRHSFFSVIQLPERMWLNTKQGIWLNKDNQWHFECTFFERAVSSSIWLLMLEFMTDHGSICFCMWQNEHKTNNYRPWRCSAYCFTQTLFDIDCMLCRWRRRNEAEVAIEEMPMHGTKVRTMLANTSQNTNTFIWCVWCDCCVVVATGDT